MSKITQFGWGEFLMPSNDFESRVVLEDAIFGDRGERPLGELWRLMNAPRPIDGRGLQLILASYLVLYVLAAVWRHDEVFAELGWVRAGVAAYTCIGIYLARARAGWISLRRYGVGFALIVPTSSALLTALQGGDIAGIVVSCLLPFAFLIFLPAAIDVVVATLGLLVCYLAIAIHLPPMSIPTSSLCLIYGGAVLGAGLTAVFVRRMACERERILRELAELTASKDDGGAILDQFASQFSWSFGGGRAMVVLCRPDRSDYEIASVAGLERRAAQSLSAAR